MAVKIIRKKRLFEDDATVQQPVTNQPSGNTPQVANTLGNAQDNSQLQNQQQTVNNQQDANQQQLPTELNDNQKAVQELLGLMKNTYWCISNNVPEMIKEKIPSFTPDNTEAKPIIDLWDAFKKDPQETTFNAFIQAFTNFGSTNVQQQNNINTLQQGTNPQQNVNAATIYNFKNALHENLSRAYHKQLTEKSLKNYF